MSKIQVQLTTIVVLLSVSLSVSWIAKHKGWVKAGSGNITRENGMVSIPELVTQPKVHDGKKVMVIGYSNFEFEANHLQLHRDPESNNASLDRVWLNISTSDLVKFKSSSGKKVVVLGVFNSKNKGHWGMYPGAIEQITEIREVSE